MRNQLRSLVAFSIASVMTATLAAKGDTVRLTVAGSGLPRPVEITTADVVAAANVWSGNFIGAPVTEPDKTLPRYTISFYVQAPGNASRKMYVVSYVRVPHTDQGFLYLPGYGDEGYRLNSSTILRDGQDGKWHAASSEWSQALAKVLP